MMLEKPQTMEKIEDIIKNAVNDIVKMTTSGEEDADGEYLDDHIYFGDTEPRLDDLQFIDPGIIDVDSSDGETAELTLQISPSRAATNHDLVTSKTKHCNPYLKPTIIKLVDCLKFPWYFDQNTRQIIDKIIFVTENLNNKTTTVKMDAQKPCKSLKKRRKVDLELQNALYLRNKSEIDIKRNTGLIGMKIQRMSIHKTKEVKETANTRANLDMLYVQSVDKALLNVGTVITPVLTDTPDYEKNKPTQGTHQKDEDEDPADCNEYKFKDKDKFYVSSEENAIFENSNDSSFQNVTKENDTILYNKAVKVAKEITRRLTEPYNTIKEIKENEELSKLKQFALKPMPMCKKIHFQQNKIYSTENSSNTESNVHMCNSTKTNKPMPLSSEVCEKMIIGKVKKLADTEKCNSQKVEDQVPTDLAPTKRNKTDLLIQQNKIDVFENRNIEIRQNVTIETLIPSTGGIAEQKQCFPIMNRFTEKVLNKIRTKKRKQQAKTIISRSVPKIQNIAKEVETKDSGTNKSFQDSSNFFIKPSDVTTNKANIPKIKLQYSKKDIPRDSVTFSVDNIHSDEHHRIVNNSPLRHHINDTYMANNKTESISDSTKHSNVTEEISPPNKVKSNDLVHQLNHISVNKARPSGQRKQSLKDVPSGNVRNIDNYVKINIKKNSIHNVALQIPKATKSPNEPNVHNFAFIEKFTELDPAKHNKLYTPRNNKNFSTPNTQVLAPPLMPISSEYQARAEPLTVYNSLQSHILYRPQTANLRAPPPPPRMFPNSPTFRYRSPMLQINQPIQQPRYPIHNLPHASYVGGIFPSMTTATQNIHHDIHWRYRFPPPLPPPPPPPPLPPPLPPQSQATTGLPLTSQVLDDFIIGRNNEGVITKINIPPNIAHLKISKKPDTNDYKLEIENVIKPGYSPSNDKPSSVPESSKLLTIKAEMHRVLDNSVERMRNPIDCLKNSIAGIHIPNPPNVFQKALPGVYDDCNIDNAKKSSCLQVTENVLNNMQKITDNIYKTMLQNNCSPSNITSTGTEKKELDFSSKLIKKNTTQVDKFHNTNAVATQPNNKNTDSLLNSKKKPHRIPDSRMISSESKSNEKNRELQKHSNKLLEPIKSLPNEHAKYAKPVPLSTHLFEDKKILINNTKSEVSQKHNGRKSKSLKRTSSSNDSHIISKDKYTPGPLSKKLKVNDPRVIYDKCKIPEERPRIGYSPPILPIPTFEKILTESMHELYDKPVKKSETKSIDGTDVFAKSSSDLSIPEKKCIQFEKSYKDGSRRISLDEYKKRSAYERRIDEDRRLYTNNQKDIAKEKNIVDMPRRVSNVDSDLGYDSDSTVRL